MVFTGISSSKLRLKKQAGMTLVEMTIASAITAILALVICASLIYSARGLSGLSNYIDLDNASRNSLDVLMQDMREVTEITSLTASAGGSTLVCQAPDGVLTFTWDSNAKTFVRSKNGYDRVLLTGCETLTFELKQRNTYAGTWELYPATDPRIAKFLQVSWKCSRPLLGSLVNTESVQTARIMLRNQHL